MTGAAATPVWGDPTAWENPAALDGDATADVCVVGLGGSGLAAVGALLDAGASVVGIDAGPIAGGAAGRNGGFLLAGGALFHHAAVEAWGEERAVGIYEESLAELDRLEQELGAIVRRVGSLRIPASDEEAEDCARQLAELERHGFPARPADGPTGPGVFIPGDGSVQPLERCRLLARRALERGARLHCGTPGARAGRRSRAHARGRGRLQGRGRVRGRRARAAAARARRARRDRRGCRCSPPSRSRRARSPAPSTTTGATSTGSSSRTAASRSAAAAAPTRETEWGQPAEAGADVQALLDRLLVERVGVEAPVANRWAGVISYTPDRLPVFAETRPGVIAVGAHSGHGNVLGSAAGRAAAAIALGDPPPRLARLLRPEHWGSP